ncbi:DUF655 domain-containing protein [Candidatus Micrarchaeota archaeon]|nr:DUF655 domain-containing protein [Candidatus Micrarchaeota archaeon]MBI5176768.1 DUF655 domain-containing protein [Candidatus Micrarchaeota archaeon]
MFKREENSLVLDFLPQGLSGEARKEPVAQLIGETYFTLLEAVAKPGANLSLGEKVYIGKGVRDKIENIRGRISLNQLTSRAKSECESQVRALVAAREPELVAFLNRAGPLSIRNHLLELLPTIGKKHLNAIITAREQKPFESFADVRERVAGIGRIEEVFVARILEELKGESKYYLFTKAPAREREGY